MRQFQLVFPCKLLGGDMQQMVINGTSEEECRIILDDTIAKYVVRCSSRGHRNLKHKTNAEHGALDIPNCSKKWSLAISCKVVLCCRVAPLQKAGIVDLIKSRTYDMTLSIGDRANDVSMIQMEDVSVGICGQEGRQMAMTSDFTMGQFQFLKR
ncbi:hypothetical protein KIW84_034332 [Lathyrus oleraceus]|uniref:Uncharacterized protein n=1 Tax=Pisum sativum TaxID=3888 RepID=A0A9D5B525_PEA|nr:hypothetical protein KIW84_034332 [Pisum sativum]